MSPVIRNGAWRLPTATSAPSRPNAQVVLVFLNTAIDQAVATARSEQGTDPTEAGADAVRARVLATVRGIWGRRPLPMQTSELERRITRVGVVGAGLMGSGIAEVCARAGLDVLVREIDEGVAAAGRTRITRSLDKGVKAGKRRSGGQRSGHRGGRSAGRS
jgi:3-hydroxyacyl-CoA dehydrogenase, NAD binding domain